MRSIPLLVFKPWLWMGCLMLALSKQRGTTLLTPSTRQLVNWKILSSVLYPVASALTWRWDRTGLLVHASTSYYSFYSRQRKILSKPTSFTSPVSEIPTWSKRYSLKAYFRAHFFLMYYNSLYNTLSRVLHSDFFS